MAFNYETPLRGWKEIMPLLGVQDERTALRILSDKNLLHYEGRTPVLIASEYLKTIPRAT